MSRISKDAERPSEGVIHLSKATLGLLFLSARKGIQTLLPRECTLEAISCNVSRTQAMGGRDTI